MYSPAEINFMFKLKKTIVVLFPTIIFFVFLIWMPPTYLLRAVGLGESVAIDQITDSISAKNADLQRKAEIITNLQAQLDACAARTAPALENGKKLPALKKFDTWADFKKKNPAKTFSNFSAAKAEFYEKQLDAIYKSVQ